MRGPDAFALGFQRRQILPGFAVAPRATFAKRRQYFKYVIIDYQGLIAAIRCALPQGPIRAVSDRCCAMHISKFKGGMRPFAAACMLRLA
jgi:nitroreductase